ncbi:MAG: UDP-2,3-diacylglucosamine diphosphatase [Bacteroidetes bacterium]|nr:MAG: UDP-2,3-diacylglucosamine diphosphatase [Bacteroidota bacterium]
MDRTNRYRTIWLSDFHLGTRECRAEYLLDFLRYNESDYLYLVGDVFDGWALARSWYWSQLHNDIVQKILRKVRKGTRAVYIPGNHDEFARDFLDLQMGGIHIQQRALHTTATGRQLLILHGDEFDGIIRYTPWLSRLGSHAYQVVLRLNRWFNQVRRRLGLPYWSLSAYLKFKTKQAVQYVGRFEEAVVREARNWDVDGVVCGHIHHAELRTIDGLLYANTGDWVESCTALVEHVDGRLEIIRWVTIDHEPHGHRPHARAPGGDGAAEKPSEAVEVQPRPAV